MLKTQMLRSLLLLSHTDYMLHIKKSWQRPQDDDDALTISLCKKGKLFDCIAMCTDEVTAIIIQLYIITGCDSLSGFFGHHHNTQDVQISKK